MLLRLAVVAATGYLALVLLLFLMQRRMLYLPDSSEPAGAFLQQQGLAYWSNANSDYRALIGDDPPASPRGTVVVFHGNAGAAWHRYPYVHALQPRGFRVLLAEYPGYGGRAGQPDQPTLVADARETVRQVQAQFEGPVYLWGESLGSGVVAAVVADAGISAAGVVLITPWDSLARLAQTHYPYVPARWLIRDRFDNVKNLGSFHNPVAVAIANEDRIVPKHHSMRLYNSLPSPKALWEFDSGHNDWPISPDHPWWSEVADFVADGRADKASAVDIR